jgi:AAR2 protein
MEAYAQATTLIILGLPENASVTLDHLAFSSTKNFRGVKYIWPGIHLLTYGFDSSELGMRSGFFFVGKPGNVLAWKWDAETEQLRRLHDQIGGRELEESTDATQRKLIFRIAIITPVPHIDATRVRRCKHDLE